MTPPDIANLPNFEGCVLSVAMKRQKGTIKIADPHWAVLDGRLFLVGRWPDHPTDPQRFAGVETAVCWEDVNHYIRFDSEADFARRMDDRAVAPRAPVVHVQ